MKSQQTTASEFASTLDLCYNKMRSIGMTAKKEVKEIILNAEYALHNAIKCAKHAPQYAPTAYTLREGSETQQYLGRAEAKKIIEAIEALDSPEANTDTKKHIGEAIDHLNDFLAKTEPAKVEDKPVVDIILEITGEEQNDATKLAAAEDELKKDNSATATNVTGEILETEKKSEELNGPGIGNVEIANPAI